MRKFLLLLAVMSLILITASCQKPEEVTLSKYFQAMKIKDTQTLAAMATDPVAIEFKDWKLIKTEEPVIEDALLPQLVKQLDEAKAKRMEQIQLIQEKKDLSDTLKTQISDSRSSRQKAELKKQLDETDTAVITETEVFKKMQSDYNQLKNLVDYEKKLTTLSIGGITEHQDLYTGKTSTVNAQINITTAAGDKEYIVVLKRYDLVNPVTNHNFSSRYLVLKFYPKQ